MPLRRRRRIILILLIVLGLIPVSVTCGTAALGYACMPAPDPSGHVNIYLEVEPLAVALVEFVAGANIPLYYYAGHHYQFP